MSNLMLLADLDSIYSVSDSDQHKCDTSSFACYIHVHLDSKPFFKVFIRRV